MVEGIGLEKKLNNVEEDLGKTSYFLTQEIPAKFSFFGGKSTSTKEKKKRRRKKGRNWVLKFRQNLANFREKFEN